jgi:hypothetical protein
LTASQLGFYTCHYVPFAWLKGFAMKEATLKKSVSASPVLLAPSLVEKMLATRKAVQVMKFRTTCTDCVPNW